MKIVITGATGNLGTSVLAALAADDRVDEIVGLARRLPSHVFPKVRFVEADVARDPLEEHFRGAHAVVHLAWLVQPAHDLAELERVNVHGSFKVFRAVASANVPVLAYASSVGAYSPSDKIQVRSEHWPTDGIASSSYSRHKSRVEQLLNELEDMHRSIRVIRFRPALIFKRASAERVKKLFLSRFVPRGIFDPRVLRLMLDHPDFRFQAVHADDVAEAFRAAIHGDARGPFNLAATPILDSDVLSHVLGARKLPFPASALRGLVSVGFKLRLQPTDPGWIDLCFRSPLLDVSRARAELGWSPKHTADGAFLELLNGLRSGASFDTPPMRPGLSFLDRHSPVSAASFVEAR